MEMSDDEGGGGGGGQSPVLPRLPMAKKTEDIPWRFSPTSPWGQQPTPKYPVRSPEEEPKERARRRLDFAQLPSLEGLRKPVNPVTAPDALVVPALFPLRQQQQQQVPARQVAAKAFQVWLDTYESARTRFVGIPHVVLRMPTVYAFQQEGSVPRYHGVNIFNEGNAFDRDQMPPQIRANMTAGGGGGLFGGGGARVGGKERAVALEFRQPLPFSDPRFVAGIDDADASLFPMPRDPFAPQWTLFRIVARADNTGALHWHLVETEGTRLARNFFGEASNIARFGVIFMEPDMPTRSYLFSRQPENPDDN